MQALIFTLHVELDNSIGTVSSIGSLNTPGKPVRLFHSFKFPLMHGVQKNICMFNFFVAAAFIELFIVRYDNYPVMYKTLHSGLLFKSVFYALFELRERIDSIETHKVMPDHGKACVNIIVRMISWKSSVIQCAAYLFVN
jgi:hypothetical protein